MLHVWKSRDDKRRVCGGVVTPDCCEAARNWWGVTVYVDPFRESPLETAPMWYVGLPELIYAVPIMARIQGNQDPAPPCFCPYCGISLPEIRLREKMSYKVADATGGDYCGCCQNRLRECHCLLPAAKYAPVTEPFDGSVCLYTFEELERLRQRISKNNLSEGS